MADWSAYLQANPQVAQDYANTDKNRFRTPEAWAQFHYDHYGKKQGLGFAPQQPAAAPQPPAAPQGNLDATTQPPQQPPPPPDTGGIPQGNLGAAPPAQPAQPDAPQGNLGTATPAQGDGLVNGQPALASWDEYLQKYPEVLRDYNNLKASVKAKFGSPAEYAEYHYRANGKAEGRQAPVEDNTYTLRTNDRDVAGGVITVDPNANYRLIDNRKKATVAGGTGVTGLDEIYRMANNLEQWGGKKADWNVEVQDPATGQWNTVAYDRKNMSTLQKVAGVALPVIGGVVGSLIPGLGTVLGSALGSALGGAAGGVIQGKSLGNIAKGALISGAAGAAGGWAGGALGGAGGAASNLGSGAIANGGTSALTEGALSAAGRAAIEGIPSIAGNVAGGIGGNLAADGAIQVLARKAPDLLAKAATAGVTNAAAQGVGQAVASTLNADGTPKAQQPGETVAPEDATIVVNASKGIVDIPPSLVKAMSTGLVDAATMEAVNKLANEDLKANPDKKGVSVGDIARYLQLASLAVGIGGALLGGKGGSGSGKIPAGLFNTDKSGFNTPLPTLTAEQQAIYGQRPRTMPDQDWDLYGRRPGQSFFTGVPMGYTPPARGVEDPLHPALGRGYAKGGKVRRKDQSLAVRGPGTERSDSIPARLSDGEYVIDAPTVRAIGSGSRERGFKRLDDLRVQARRLASPTAPKSLGAL